MDVIFFLIHEFRVQGSRLQVPGFRFRVTVKKA
jgi:hypothetical protein